MSDLISRDALLAAIDCERHCLIEQNRLGAEHVVVHNARRIIEDFPYVDAIPVEWLTRRMIRADDESDFEMRDSICILADEWQREQEVEP